VQTTILHLIHLVQRRRSLLKPRGNRGLGAPGNRTPLFYLLKKDWRDMYFQDVILELQKYWAEQGCIILQPYDMEVGAGTSSPATMLGLLSNEAWNVVYVQPSRRPTDGRYGENPNRVQHYYQLQVIFKPSPENLQDLCIQSLVKLGIDPKMHDIRFVEDDWENPTLGAWGLGWEVWCDGMEVIQFTYMQQVGGVECIAGEVTYGLERLTMFLQNVDSIWDIAWNAQGVKYGDVYKQSEYEYSAYNFEFADVNMLKHSFQSALKEAEALLQKDVIYPAYDQCLKASHLFNILEARGEVSVVQRASYIANIRDMSRSCCQKMVERRLLRS
jgi:glycyl-tRNA synthetase alpha chain